MSESSILREHLCVLADLAFARCDVAGPEGMYKVNLLSTTDERRVYLKRAAACVEVEFVEGDSEGMERFGPQAKQSTIIIPDMGRTLFLMMHTHAKIARTMLKSRLDIDFHPCGMEYRRDVEECTEKNLTDPQDRRVIRANIWKATYGRIVGALADEDVDEWTIEQLPPDVEGREF